MNKYLITVGLSSVFFALIAVIWMLAYMLWQKDC